MGLTGPSSFYLSPQRSDVYKAIYNPITPTPLNKEYDLGYVFFSSYTLGEFCYELHLYCEELPEVELNLMKAELGLFSLQIITIDNTLPYSVSLEIQSSNPGAFIALPMFPLLRKILDEQELESSKSKIPTASNGGSGNSVNDKKSSLTYKFQSVVRKNDVAHVKVLGESVGEAIVRYTPTTIDKEEEAEIKLYCKNGGLI
jgi:hypothetical protein